MKSTTIKSIGGGILMDNEIKTLLKEAEAMLNRKFIEGSHKEGRRVDPVTVNRLGNVQLSNNTRVRLMSLVVRGR
jgi:hypothetical protein